MGNEAILHVFFVIFIDESKADLRLMWKKNGKCLFFVFSSMKISKADLRLKMKKYGNEAILHVFFDIFIHESQANLRLKWKKWEIFVLCILIDTHEIANQKKTI